MNSTGIHTRTEGASTSLWYGNQFLMGVVGGESELAAALLQNNQKAYELDNQAIGDQGELYENLYCTAPEAIQELQAHRGITVTADSIVKAVKAGRLQGHQVGEGRRSVWLIDRDSLAEWKPRNYPNRK